MVISHGAQVSYNLGWSEGTRDDYCFNIMVV